MRIGRTAVVTDTGRRRIGNEDAFVFKPPVFAIADGMGGARAGEIAAGLAAAALEEGAEPTSAEGIVALIDEANRQIWERSIQDPDTSGMGTTVTAALVAAEPGKVVIGHVGDSRAYFYRDGALAQLTTDHSGVVELVESGILTPEEAERHPRRSARSLRSRQRTTSSKSRPGRSDATAQAPVGALRRSSSSSPSSASGFSCSTWGSGDDPSQSRARCALRRRRGRGGRALDGDDRGLAPSSGVR